ncbi:MAG: hypothetical protein M3O62_09840 [Pseudomonadota bacterium]|nr:hypothetical protein [Pseudomonadota bacterium]
MIAVETTAQRIQRAEKLWKQGDIILSAGNRERAYKLYTEAHDAIVDCPRLHLTAHRKLRLVTRYHRNKTEFITDNILVWLAPIGIFELIGLFTHSRVRREALRRRGA